MNNPLVSAIEKRWYGKPGCLLLLSPLEWLFGAVAQKRRMRLARECRPFPVPVVVVGNITVGGTGKTPTIIALVRFLQKEGYRPGVVSRGYGRDPNPLVLLDASSAAAKAGDEPLLIYEATRCDVAVADDRVVAIERLIQERHCDVILADDGLQHYRMSRDLEIVVIDSHRLFGNGHMLPVGPLRESPARLNEVDWVLVNVTGTESVVSALPKSSRQIHIVVTGVTRITDGAVMSVDELQRDDTLVAVAGIGNPEKFFATLNSLGLVYEKQVFPDHHRYTAGDLAPFAHRTVIMTEKDAVKCRQLVGEQAYSLNVCMQLPSSFLEEFTQSLEQLSRSA